MPYSDAIFACTFPRECTESFLEGHVRAFEFFGGVAPPDQLRQLPDRRGPDHRPARGDRELYPFTPLRLARVVLGGDLDVQPDRLMVQLLDLGELRHRLATSYRLVRSGLPKKVQAELGPFA